MAFILILLMFLLLAIAVIWALEPENGGDMLDRFYVVNSATSPDGHSIAVLYRWSYAELTADGRAIWIQNTSDEVRDSKSGNPKGQPAVAWTWEADDIRWRWGDDGSLLVVDPGIADIQKDSPAPGCFWDHSDNGSWEHKGFRICVQSILVRIIAGP